MSLMREGATLAELMEGSRLPVADALRLAMSLAEALRRLHDGGEIHGALSPAIARISAAGIELMPPVSGPAMSITPYTAPEALMGRVVDARSDIFAFGAILFEMLTGRRAFVGEGRTALAANIANAPTPASGSPAVDRLVGPCMARNPEARMPRMQNVIMELKLLNVAARRAAAPRRERIDAGAIRGEMLELESRLAARLYAHEKATGETQRSAMDAVAMVKCQLSVLRAELQEQQRAVPAAAAPARDPIEVSSGRVLSQVHRSLQTVSENIAAVERTVEGMKRHAQQFERAVAADLAGIGESFKLQTSALDSARTAMSQTDDLVERVVEALESLQNAVLDPPDPSPGRAAYAIN
jgi:hypothetical protein